MYIYSIVYVKCTNYATSVVWLKPFPSALHPTSEKRKGEEVISLQLLLQYQCFVAGDIMPITPYKSLYCVFSTILKCFFFLHSNIKVWQATFYVISNS